MKEDTIKKLNKIYNDCLKETSVNDQNFVSVGSGMDGLEIYKELIFYEYLKILKDDDVFEDISKRQYLHDIIINSLIGKKFPDWQNIYKFLKRKTLLNTNELYSIIFPIPIKFNENFTFPFKILSIGGLIIKVVSYEYISKNYSIMDLHQYYKENNKYFYNENFKFLNIEVESFNEQSAFDKAYNVFNMYRSIFNCSEHFQRFQWYLGIKLNSLTSLKSPDIFLIKNITKNKFGNTFYEMENYESSVSSIPEIKMDIRESSLYKALLSIYKRKDYSELEILILNVIQYYNSALDTPSRSIRFLNFWRVCEYSTLIGSRNNNQVINLIKNYYSKDVHFQEIGDILCFIRNRFVHTGKFYSITDRHTNWMKEYSEASIQILLYLHKKGLKTLQEVQIFFEYYPLKNRKKNDLKMREQIINILKK